MSFEKIFVKKKTGYFLNAHPSPLMSETVQTVQTVQTAELAGTKPRPDALHQVPSRKFRPILRTALYSGLTKVSFIFSALFCKSVLTEGNSTSQSSWPIISICQVRLQDLTNCYSIIRLNNKIGWSNTKTPKRLHSLPYLRHNQLAWSAGQ